MKECGATVKMCTSALRAARRPGAAVLNQSPAFHVDMPADPSTRCGVGALTFDGHACPMTMSSICDLKPAPDWCRSTNFLPL